mmetsp:Transcript_43155/g.85088  ORF Transcript_43155/g.85088 Transcript_43155/m.85088 type:complete len:162 (-) Transcript_43155:1402-1887(-)
MSFRHAQANPPTQKMQRRNNDGGHRPARRPASQTGIEEDGQQGGSFTKASPMLPRRKQRHQRNLACLPTNIDRQVRREENATLSLHFLLSFHHAVVLLPVSKEFHPPGWQTDQLAYRPMGCPVPCQWHKVRELRLSPERKTVKSTQKSEMRGDEKTGEERE